ncbi:MAG: PEP-CTERM sorting domain-containing protein, partial [Roseibacillus sp.]
GVESGTGIFASETDTGTDPLDADSDGDGLVDGAEASANPFVTDPNKQDTDEDGVNDDTEISGGSDPTDPTDVPAGGGGGGVISMNFDGQSGTGTPGAVTGVAGSVPVGNWNNSGQGNANNVGPLALVDATGDATGATVNWSVANHWTTNGGDSSGGDATMMQGYLDNFHDRPPIEITGIPYALYELRIYHNTDSGGAMGFTVSDDGGLTSTTYYSYQPGGNNSNFPLAGADPFGGAAGYVGSQETSGGVTNGSNYTLFTGLTGADLSIQGVRGAAGDTRTRPNGFQITQVPEPSSMLLLVLGSAGIFIRRRR